MSNVEGNKPQLDLEHGGQGAAEGTLAPSTAKGQAEGAGGKVVEPGADGLASMQGDAGLRPQEHRPASQDDKQTKPVHDLVEDHQKQGAKGSETAPRKDSGTGTSKKDESGQKHVQIETARVQKAGGPVAGQDSGQVSHAIRASEISTMADCGVQRESVPANAKPTQYKNWNQMEQMAGNTKSTDNTDISQLQGSQ